MALVIDSTVGGANSNSYVTLAEANTYFESRLNVTTWTDITDDDIKNRALVQATRRLDYENFYGERERTTQALKFPRSGIGYLDGIYMDGIIPPQIKEATFELAIYMLSVDMSKPSVNTSNIQEAKVGSISVKYAIDKNDNVSQSYDTLPPFVDYLLDGLSNTAGSGSVSSVYR